MRMVEEFNLNECQSNAWPCPMKQRTDVPARMGTCMSKTIIRAVNTVASGIKFVGGHNTLPILRWMESTAVK